LNDGLLIPKSERGRRDCRQRKNHQHGDHKALAGTATSLPMGIAYTQTAQVGPN
jgi:hypothetical protein